MSPSTIITLQTERQVSIQENMWTRKKQFIVLCMIPVYFLIAGLFLQPLSSIKEGLIKIFQEPDFLITDYMAVGGIGAALVNASLLTLVCIGIIYILGMKVSGQTITSAFMMFGFSLFGKNLINIWAILIGVFLYARYLKYSLANYIYIGFYGTSLSPLIMQVMQMERFTPMEGLLAGGILGIAIGFALPPLVEHVQISHKGYSLYNVGFASGIMATIIVSLMKSLGMQIQTRLIWHTGTNEIFEILLLLLFVGIIAAGIIHSPKETYFAYKKILKSSGIGGTDYLKEVGFPAVLINIGVNGLIASLFVISIGGDLNGPTIGGIMTIAGFGATGKHIRNIVPVMAGVYLASIIELWDITAPSALLAMLFSTTLAPIAGEFGILPGLVAGFLHSSVALNVGILYEGMNLYNNGFAGGIIATFMVPTLQAARKSTSREKKGVYI